MKPSVDRLDDYKSYSLDNIQLVTWEDNRLKANHNIVNGINNKQNRIILQLDLEGNIIKEFFSINEAARVMNGSAGTLHNCCTGIQKTGYGYKWRFK